MLIFSDLHLEEKSADVALEVLRSIPKQDHGGHVVFLGDFWMVRHTLPAKLLLEVRDILRSWIHLGVSRVDVVVGNHDMTSTDGRNVLEVFDGLDHTFFVHTQPTWTAAGFMLPWRANNDEIRRVLVEARQKRGEPAVLFAHIALLGAWMNNLKKDEGGFPADELLAMGWRRVFAGHYHRPGVVVPGVEYVGSTYQVTYAEAGQEKRFVCWDGEKAVDVPVVFGKRHHKLVIDVDHPAPIDLPAVRPGDKLWVVVKGHAAVSASEVVKANLKKVGLEAERFELDLQPEERAQRIEVKAGESHLDLAQRFLDAQDVAPDFREMLRETLRRMTHGQR